MTLIFFNVIIRSTLCAPTRPVYACARHTLNAAHTATRPHLVPGDMPRNEQHTLAEQRPLSRDLRVLKQLLTFLRPYRCAVLGAAVSLLIAAGAVLGSGVILQRLVDHGLSSGSGTAPHQALLLFLIVIAVISVSVATRVYLVIRFGEPVVADIRKAVFARLLKLEPAGLLLDGATSALDAESERLVQDALEQLMQARHRARYRVSACDCAHGGPNPGDGLRPHRRQRAP
jgi:ABC-type bacteriocin/lantibiotic exporter with double-glycine peptidase domain